MEGPLTPEQYYQFEASHDRHANFIEERVLVAAEFYRKYCRKVDKFLDIGCGDGTIARYLGDVLGAKHVLGIEIS